MHDRCVCTNSFYTLFLGVVFLITGVMLSGCGGSGGGSSSGGIPLADDIQARIAFIAGLQSASSYYPQDLKETLEQHKVGPVYEYEPYICNKTGKTVHVRGYVLKEPQGAYLEYLLYTTDGDSRHSGCMQFIPPPDLNNNKIGVKQPSMLIKKCTPYFVSLGIALSSAQAGLLDCLPDWNCLSTGNNPQLTREQQDYRSSAYQATAKPTARILLLAPELHRLTAPHISAVERGLIEKQGATLLLQSALNRHAQLQKMLENLSCEQHLYSRIQTFVFDDQTSNMGKRPDEYDFLKGFLCATPDGQQHVELIVAPYLHIGMNKQIAPFTRKEGIHLVLNLYDRENSLTMLEEVLKNPYGFVPSLSKPPVVANSDPQSPLGPRQQPEQPIASHPLEDLSTSDMKSDPMEIDDPEEEPEPASQPRMEDNQTPNASYEPQPRYDLPDPKPWLQANYMRYSDWKRREGNELKPDFKRLRAYYDDVLKQLYNDTPVQITPSRYRHPPTRKALVIGAMNNYYQALLNTLFSAARSTEERPRAQAIVPVRYLAERLRKDLPPGERQVDYPEHDQLNQQEVEVHCYATLYQPKFSGPVGKAYFAPIQITGYVFQDQASGEYIELINMPNLVHEIGCVADPKILQALRTLLQTHNIHQILFVVLECERLATTKGCYNAYQYEYHDALATLFSHCTAADIDAGRIHFVVPNISNDANHYGNIMMLKKFLLQELGRYPASMRMNAEEPEACFYGIRANAFKVQQLHQGGIETCSDRDAFHIEEMYEEARRLLQNITQTPTQPLERRIDSYNQHITRIAQLLAPKLIIYRTDLYEFHQSHVLHARTLEERYNTLKKRYDDHQQEVHDIEQDIQRYRDTEEPSADLDKLLTSLGICLEYKQQLRDRYKQEYQEHQAILARAHQNDAAIAAEYQQLQQHVDFVDYDQFYRQLFFELGLAVQQRLVPEYYMRQCREKVEEISPLYDDDWMRFTAGYAPPGHSPIQIGVKQALSFLFTPENQSQQP